MTPFGAHARLRLVTHPSLGTPPRDLRAGFPAAAERLRGNRERLGVRTLEIAIDRDPTFTERHDEIALRRLLRDTEPMIERLAIALASNDHMAYAAWAEWIAPVYRRRRVPMDDLVTMSEGLRLAVVAVVTPDEAPLVNAAIDEGIRVFRWHRRLAGDARKRNRLLAAIYKGA
jgi:hypothetical protein